MCWKAKLGFFLFGLILAGSLMWRVVDPEAAARADAESSEIATPVVCVMLAFIAVQAALILRDWWAGRRLDTLGARMDEVKQLQTAGRWQEASVILDGMEEEVAWMKQRWCKRD